MTRSFFKEGYPKSGSRPPLIWTIDLEDETAVYDWSQSQYSALEAENAERAKQEIDNLCRYKGFYSDYIPIVGGVRLPSKGTSSKNDWASVLVNHTQDLIEQKVSKLTTYKPNTAITPATNEIKDKNDADVTKKVLDAIKYSNDLDSLRTRIIRTSVGAGECYLYFGWDDYLGEKKKGKQDPTKIKFASFKGEADVTLELQKRVGDICFEIKRVGDVFLLPARDLYEVPGVCIKSYKHVDELRAMYPDKQDEIVPTEESRYRFDYDSLEDTMLDDEIEVYEWWFKSSKYLPNGLYFAACPTCVLSMPEDNPWPVCDSSDFGNIPLERLTDIDIEGEIHGSPSQNNINGLQARYDRITARIFRSVIRYSTPKWVYPQNSVNPADLTNDDTNVPFTGPQPPSLETTPSITQDLFQTWQETVTLMEKTFGIFSISRGAPPPGTRAAAQMIFLEEQEKQRQSVFQRKVDKFTVNCDKKILSIVSLKYGEDENRLLSILGADKRWQLVDFSIDQIRKPVNIRIENASWLPDSKFARITALNEMLKIPFLQQMFRPEQIAEMYEFGQQEKFLDAAKMAVVAAQGENEALMSGKEVLEPSVFEEQIVHWREHDKFFQHPHFKRAPKETQTAATDHLLGHEYLMIEKAMGNEAFKQQLLMLPEFPRFLILPAGWGATSTPPSQTPNEDPQSAGSSSDETQNQQPPNGAIH